MIERKPHDRIRLVECPICRVNLRSALPSAHIKREHSPEDVGLTRGPEGEY